MKDFLSSYSNAFKLLNSLPSYIADNKMFARLFLYFGIFILGADWLYKTTYSISLQNRWDCFIYKNIPRSLFLIYEYFVELFLLVAVGIFIAVLIEKHFRKLKNIIPGNQVAAFLLASVLPVCSCSVIPLIQGLNGKIKSRTLITFITAAPILNPYIIVLSFSAIGFEYGVLRIISSFLLSFSLGWIIELYLNSNKSITLLPQITCSAKSQNCSIPFNEDIYVKTISIFRKLLPYLLFAGFTGILFEFYNPTKFLQNWNFNNSLYETLAAIAIGIPVYLCNGADIFFLRPLMNSSGLTMGAAISFSLTSTVVCSSSIIMLSRFLGKRITAIIVLYIIVFCFLSAQLINYFS